MNQEDRETERRRVLEMIEIEEKLGPVVSGGPAGGSRQRAQPADHGRPPASPPVAIRARGRVRFLAYAVAVAERRAA